ncbi:adenylosuccinate lyase family protein [Streptomyces sp. NPDC088348]|uniref:class-II fumarase/aspartase family protein n=1 Tax=Streptomyces sp. NPDC088348 TaxID=3365853 RepID=UPI00382F5927
MTQPPETTVFLDTGLLTPVRAGAPVEAETADFAWLQAMLDAEAGLVRAQARLGLVPVAAAGTISRLADASRLDLRDLAVRTRGAANPVVAVVEAFTAHVGAEDPGAAEYVHRGSTSQDIMDTAAMLVGQRAGGLIHADLLRAADALAGLAGRHRDTLLAGRTLGAHAVPTTFGLKAAGWLDGVLRAADRLGAVLGSGLPVQLGGAAGTLAGYVEQARIQGVADAAETAPRLLAAYAAELGLAEPLLPWHTTRAPLVELGQALVLCAGALDKVAVDVQVLSRTEIAEVAEPAAPGRGVSSAMPHKRNPALATLIRTAGLQVPSLVLVLAQAMAAEGERPAGAWHAEWQPLRESLRLTGGAAYTAVQLVEGLTVFPERMRDNLGLTGGLVVSERIAADLTPALGKAAARELLNRASAEAARTGRPLADVLTGAPELAGVAGAAEVLDLLDPAHYTGAAGVLVDRALAAYRAR